MNIRKEMFDMGVVESVLETLQPRLRDCLRLYCGISGNQQRTMVEISAVFGVSRERVRKYLSRAVRLYKTKLTLHKQENRQAKVLFYITLARTTFWLQLASEWVASDIESRLIAGSQIPVRQLGLSVRSYNALMRTRCDVVGDVISLIASDRIWGIRNLGKKSIAEIVETVDSMFFTDGETPAKERIDLLAECLMSR